jgi:acetylornithine deacetylase/succinyl-diaminopimelate desuccinylase-like protein
MRHFCAREIPCVMLGPPGLERAHAADEFVSVDDLVRVARAIALTILRFGS